MNLSAHTTAASYRSGQPIQRTDDTIGFLSALYSGMRGYCELLYAAYNPRDGLTRAGWYWIDSADQRTIQTLGLAARELAAQFGDVYISLSLYARRERSLASVLDTAWLFVDDCPQQPALAYTMALETSKGNYQGFYKASQPVPASQRAALSRALAAHLHADPSGADLTQVCRVPGTFNTKRPDSPRWPVALASYNPQPLPLDALLAAYPTAAMQLDARAALDALDASAARWLANINQLIDRDGIPYRVKNPKARALWAASWPDSSAQRYAFAVSLVMHGYVDCEAAAILAHCAASPTAIRKGQSWHAADIYRCIAKARAAYPAKRPPSPTLPTKRGQLQLQNQPAASTLAASLPAKPKPVGRASKVTAAQLLAFYQREADTPTHCLMSRQEVAKALGCSQRLIAALDQELAAMGRARREVSKDRALSWVVLLDELEGGDRVFGSATIQPSTTASSQPNTASADNFCTTKNSEFSPSQSDRSDDSNLDIQPISNTPPNKNPKTKTSPSSSPVGCQTSHDCADLPSSQPSPIPQASSQLASISPVPTPRCDFDEKSEPNTFVLDSDSCLISNLNQALTLKKSEPNTFVLGSVFGPKAAQRAKSAAAAAAALDSATKAALAGDRGLMLAWLGKYSQLAASSRLAYDAGLVEHIHSLLRTASSA